VLESEKILHGGKKGVWVLSQPTEKTNEMILAKTLDHEALISR